MTYEENLCNLEEITSKYNVVLVDTCALFHHLEHMVKKGFLKDFSNKFYELELDCIIEMFNFLEDDYPIYITPLVKEEAGAVNSYHIKKKIKKSGSCKNRRLLEYRRDLEKSNKARRKLVDNFQDKERIIELDERRKNVYDDFYGRYGDLFARHKLSECDADFLISGRVLAKTDMSSALISNDFGIWGAWRDIIRSEGIGSKFFGFYNRMDENKFKRL
jgi:hypothetical protein